MLHEECGVFGIYHHAQAAVHTYFGLHALQHRGQEGAGIASSDGRQLYCQKGRGLVSDVFSQDTLKLLPGDNSIGHVRYSTAGPDVVENVQPLVARSQIGSIAVAHNGQIVNANVLRRELEEQGSIFFSSSDSEIILHLIQRGHGTLAEKICGACRRMEGAFAFVVLTEHTLYAVRDANGLRPLSLARFDGGYCVSSESCASLTLGARWHRDILPGEVLKLSAQGLLSCFYTEKTRQRLCAMEYIYFARPDSVIDGISVHESRRRAGELLAERYPVDADLVTGVPDSGLDAALGFSERSGIPYGIGLIKNKYIGRTFISPGQRERLDQVRIKLSPVRSVIEGKRVVLIDDSIVRGTTSRRIVKLLRDAGAREIHMRISAPPFLHPCYYGTDIDSEENLIACHHTTEEIAKLIGVDSLGYLEVESLGRLTGSKNYCAACFQGDYPTKIPADLRKDRFERRLSEEIGGRKEGTE